jgi:ABC-type molybdate transport system substrate-binding protein
MKIFLLLLVAVLISACTNTPVSSQETMKAFTSDKEVLSYFKDLAEKRKKDDELRVNYAPL